MKRSTSITIRVGIVVLLAILTAQKERHSRYHLDTWEQQSFVTIRAFGIPVWRHQSPSAYRYRDTYAQITGRQPDPDRWLVRRPDHVASLLGPGGFRCGSMGFEYIERRRLLGALYEAYRKGMPRDAAASLLQRINAAVPAVLGKPASPDPKALDELRGDLGLDRPLKKVAPEAVPPTPGEREKPLH